MSSNYFILLLNTNISNNKIKNVYTRYAKASSNLKFPDKYSSYITIVIKDIYKVYALEAGLKRSQTRFLFVFIAKFWLHFLFLSITRIFFVMYKIKPRYMKVLYVV